MDRAISPLQFRHEGFGSTIEQEAPGRSLAPPPLQLQTGPPSEGMPGNPQTSTGSGNLPEDLRSGMENLSGIDLGDVNVHYNSEKPAVMEAHAFAQGTDIHDDDLRDSFIENGGVKEGQKWKGSESAQISLAKNSATWERQNGKDQNPLLGSMVKTVENQSEDSEDEYSDDGDPIYLGPYLNHSLGDMDNIGKAPVGTIPNNMTMDQEQFQSQHAWIKGMKTEVATGG